MNNYRDLNKKNTYYFNKDKFRSVPAWVRKLAEDVYGTVPGNETFIRDYHLNSPLQDVVDTILNKMITSEDLTQVLTDDTTKAPSSAAVKAADDVIVNYINDQIAALPEPMQYIGDYNVETNTPSLTLPDNTKGGYTYTVTGSGDRFGHTWTPGDVLIIDNEGNAQKWDVHDAAIGNKLDKVSTKSSLKRAYAINENGTQTVFNLRGKPAPDTIVFRDFAGRFEIADATKNSEPVPLGQADNRYAVKSVETTKQDNLISGVNLKTVGLQSLLGPGNISIPSTAEFASKAELAPYISSKNAWVPDLAGKTYLGDGEYEITGQLKYNVLTGIFTLNGAFASETHLSIVDNEDFVGNDLVLQYIFLSGTLTGGLQIDSTGNYNWWGNLSNSNSTMTKTNYSANNIRLIALSGTNFTNVKFKLQIEKGTEATPFAVPAGVIPYIPEVKSELDSGYVKTTGDQTITGKKTFTGALTASDYIVTNWIVDKAGLRRLVELIDGFLRIGGDFPLRLHSTDNPTITSPNKNGEILVSSDLDWKLIATNNSVENEDIINLPAGTKEILITSFSTSTVQLPNVVGERGLSIIRKTATALVPGPTWVVWSNHIKREWEGVTPTYDTFNIYVR